MSRTLFDTSAVIGLVERRSDELVEIVSALGGPILRSLTVLGELQHGASTTTVPGTAERATTLERYLRLSAWADDELDLDELGRLYGIVSAVSAAPELRTGMNDRWVIAECLALDTELVTCDRSQAHLVDAVAEALGVNPVATFVS